MVVRAVTGYVLFRLNLFNVCGHGGGGEKKNTGSTLAERIKFANPHSSIASMVSFSGDSWKMEGHTTFLAPKCSALMLFALMKMILLSCWQKNFSKAHVKCQFQRNIFSATLAH